MKENVQIKVDTYFCDEITDYAGARQKYYNIKRHYNAQEKHVIVPHLNIF